jgi:hypothetical protein
MGKLPLILEQSGATKIHERVVNFRIEAPIERAEFWELRSETSAALRKKLTTLTGGERIRVGQEVQEAAREFFQNNLMTFPAQAYRHRDKTRMNRTGDEIVVVSF